MSQSLLRSGSAIIRRHDHRGPLLSVTVISSVAIIFLITGFWLGRVSPPSMAVNQSCRGLVNRGALSNKHQKISVFVGILVRSPTA